MKENGLTLSPILCNGMILQRDTVNRIYGTETIADTVTVYFMDTEFSALVENNSDFCIELPPVAAGGPYRIKVVGSGEITIEDIMFGDVYILSGQSNMELPIRRVLDVSGEEINNTSEPIIRQYHLPPTFNFSSPEKYMYEGQWKKAVEEDLMDFSAAGYFFAKEIKEKYQVPVGLILSAVGGSKVESWMKPSTLSNFGDYEKIIEEFKAPEVFKRFLADQQKAADDWLRALEASEHTLSDTENYKEWDTCKVPSLVSDYNTSFTGSVYLCREVILDTEPEGEDSYIYMGSIIDADKLWINGELIGRTEYRYPPRKYDIKKGILKKGSNQITLRILINNSNGGTIKGKPYHLYYNGKKINLTGDWYYRIGKKADTAMPPVLFPPLLPICFYNTVVAPLSKIEVKGILWYQGESNTADPKDYFEKFTAMVTDWRAAAGRELPFISVQLANYREPLNTSEDTGWAELREQQRQTLTIKTTALVTALDIGEENDLHPQNKKELGIRLARAAEQLIYKETTIPMGPLPKEVNVLENGIKITFDYLEETEKEYELNNFELADQKGIYHPASALRKGKYVTVTYKEKSVPTAVRYAWCDNPHNINFYNTAGLPAPGFRLTVA
jgi:sialate O-acetylesterase